MIKLKDLLKESIDTQYEFVGFHRQQHKRPSKIDDIFTTNGNGKNYYGKEYFLQILDSLYNNDRLEATNRGWFDFDWTNTYSDDYDEMEELVMDWLNDKGYRWLFVTENRPHDIAGYGDYIYKIYFKNKDILAILDDPHGANDIAYAYLYNIKNPPKYEEIVV